MDAAGRLSDLPVYIDDTPYQGMVEMRGKSRRLHLERGLDLVMVDYMQLVQGQNRNHQNRVQEDHRDLPGHEGPGGRAGRRLIACSQMSRMVENRPSHRPQLSDLRDSGSLEQDADVVMFIHGRTCTHHRGGVAADPRQPGVSAGNRGADRGQA